MMKGPRGGSTTLGQTRSQSPQKLILHHFSAPHPPNRTILLQLTGEKDGQVDQKKPKDILFADRTFISVMSSVAWFERGEMEFNPRSGWRPLWGEKAQCVQLCQYHL